MNAFHEALRLQDARHLFPLLCADGDITAVKHRGTAGAAILGGMIDAILRVGQPFCILRRKRCVGRQRFGGLFGIDPCRTGNPEQLLLNDRRFLPGNLRHFRIHFRFQQAVGFMAGPVIGHEINADKNQFHQD